MDVASARGFISSHPPPPCMPPNSSLLLPRFIFLFRSVKDVSLVVVSSLSTTIPFMVGINQDWFLVASALFYVKTQTFVASSLAAQRGETRRSVGVQCSIRCNPFKVRDKKNSRRLLSVRSDLSGAAATPESTTYPEPEIKLSSRLRGICFCLVAGVSAIVLIVLMIIGHPFVLLLTATGEVPSLYS
ncbi:hypothetical protein Rs2_45911 [Raphanus sativus]|nr:hypothetical protein Rs2_45911 [Raphanus sativus]